MKKTRGTDSDLLVFTKVKEGDFKNKKKEKVRGEREGEKMKPTIMAISVILFLHNRTNLMSMILIMWRKMIVV